MFNLWPSNLVPVSLLQGRFRPGSLVSDMVMVAPRIDIRATTIDIDKNILCIDVPHILTEIDIDKTETVIEL